MTLTYMTYIYSFYHQCEFINSCTCWCSKIAYCLQQGAVAEQKVPVLNPDTSHIFLDEPLFASINSYVICLLKDILYIKVLWPSGLRRCLDNQS